MDNKLLEVLAPAGNFEKLKAAVRYGADAVYELEEFAHKLKVDKTFTGWPAQIIQHEIDHCNGILI